jgi:hypothetical protein
MRVFADGAAFRLAQQDAARRRAAQQPMPRDVSAPVSRRLQTDVMCRFRRCLLGSAGVSRGFKLR